ncbi:MAG: hypothetical protein QNJ63_18650 [Calothrix sp. MO_192.B10]|nr:hypothetical protein [Calothrix sp. MO_192.B10]
MRTITEPIHNQPSSTNQNNYSPSVPLSVYRDLAAELQATQAKLNTLAAKNQKLAQENHLLRQEIAKVVKSVLHLQNWGNISDDSVPGNNPNQSHQVSPSPETAKTNSQTTKLPTPPTEPPSYTQDSSFIPPVVEMPISPEPVFIEEQEVSYYPTSEEKTPMNGWWLVFCILLIIFTAFGTGYLIVRPLFQNHSR